MALSCQNGSVSSPFEQGANAVPMAINLVFRLSLAWRKFRAEQDCACPLYRPRR